MTDVESLPSRGSVLDESGRQPGESVDDIVPTLNYAIRANNAAIRGDYTTCTPATYNPRERQLAYGRRGVMKLLEELSSGTLAQRIDAAMQLVELCHDPLRLAEALQHGVVSILNRVAAAETDLTMRQRSTELLLRIAAHAQGRDALLAETAFATLAGYFDENNDLVRRNVWGTIQLCTTSAHGVNEFVGMLLFPLIFPKLLTERLENQVLLLEILEQCLRHGRPSLVIREALDHHVMDALAALIKDDAPSAVKAAACRGIMALAFVPEGRAVAIAHPRAIDHLIVLLSDHKSAVRAAAAGALMIITIDVEGKRAVVRANAVVRLIAMLDDSSEAVLLNVLKLMTNMTEDYRGRLQLLPSVPTIQALADRAASRQNNNRQLLAAAEKAMEVIQWRP
ncbi:hypothetical protein CXG81DRAFT_17627 [Caulochytrium protostelioides]|uniref:ARM repeat-containing protein n=1 Tax=Caulochytrium protostelioides TaxID=1555241 RepID=A0A4P9XBI4_9FUNG|nr:hypothetical protein CXG81DRAFT_17627 [Caulochytrium protostelioides]|eukprot:RKP02742.1 hypothetical protein CXG81DRAFT_17627 [Caulochytrium protostelioides]